MNFEAKGFTECLKYIIGNLLMTGQTTSTGNGGNPDN